MADHESTIDHGKISIFFSPVNLTRLQDVGGKTPPHKHCAGLKKYAAASVENFEKVVNCEWDSRKILHFLVCAHLTLVSFGQVLPVVDRRYPSD